MTADRQRYSERRMAW